MLHIRKCKLGEFDSHQATLIKNNIGLSKFSRSTPLLKALRIDTISYLYYKFKLIFLDQIKKNYQIKKLNDQ